jgi:hypothetical protein
LLCFSGFPQQEKRQKQEPARQTELIDEETIITNGPVHDDNQLGTEEMTQEEGEKEKRFPGTNEEAASVISGPRLQDAG